MRAILQLVIHKGTWLKTSEAPMMADEQFDPARIGHREKK
jgi:hypothetical protein